MGLKTIVKRTFRRRTSPEVTYECARCGTTLSTRTAECPHCGEVEVLTTPLSETYSFEECDDCHDC